MEIKINIEKKYVWMLILVISAVGLAVAYNYPGAPSVMGHTVGEVEGLDQKIIDVINAPGQVGEKIVALESKNTCPTGMGGVGDFCIDSVPQGPAHWDAAAVICSNRGTHLCTGAEWLAGCTYLDPATNFHPFFGPPGEWAGDVMGTGSGNTDAAATYGYIARSNNGQCWNTYAGIRIDTNAKFRCCKNRI